MFIRMTAEELKATHAKNRAAGRPAARRGSHQKYSNQRVTDAEGQKFDSKAEHRHWLHLQALAKAGKIMDLRRQVPFELVPAQVTPDGKKIRSVVYVADFVYYEKGTGKIAVDDPKGFSTPEWKIKRKLMLMVHNIWVREVRS